MKSYGTLHFAGHNSRLLWTFWIVILVTLLLLLFPRRAFGSEQGIPPSTLEMTGRGQAI